jgi:hypothetical protein
MHWSGKSASSVNRGLGVLLRRPRLAVLLRQKDELALFEGVAQPEGFAGPGKGLAAPQFRNMEVEIVSNYTG